MSAEMRENFEILLQSPEHPEYWEAWEEVLEGFSILGKDGRKYTFMQDQDVFALDIFDKV